MLHKKLLLALALCAALLVPGQAAAESGYIRLHILAESDSLTDQAAKLSVRDSVRACAARILDGCPDADTAWRVLRDSESTLLSAAQEGASEWGSDAEISLETGVFPFPDRVYAGELVPAGDYRAIRITIGKGEGRNWWCMVYPSMCLPEDADVDAPVEFYSSVCRWFMRLKEAIFR